MTLQQRRFAQEFAVCGNAAEAARRAGYSPKTARSQGQRLLTKVDILDYVRELQETTEATKIASVREIKLFWSSLMNDPEQRTADRLKASELLARSAGLFVRGSDEVIFGAFSDSSDEDPGDVLIYLPDNGRDVHLQRTEGMEVDCIGIGSEAIQSDVGGA